MSDPDGVGPKEPAPWASVVGAPGVDPKLVRRLRGWALGSGIVAIMVGAVVLMGWALHLDVLTGPIPNQGTIKVNAALCFILVGTALCLSLRPSRGARRVAVGCSLFVIAVGAVTLLEYATSRNLGIDELVFRDSRTQAAGVPGRMSPLAAASFILLGASLLIVGRAWRQWLATGPVLAGLLALLGYMYGVSALYQVGDFTRIAPNAAVTFVVVGLGVIVSEPTVWPLALIASRGPGGVVARRLFAAVVIAMPFLGWLRLQGERAGLYDTQFGVAALVAVSVLLLVAVVFATAAGLGRADAGRLGAELARAESETRHQHILDNAPALIYAKDPQGRYLMVNRQYELQMHRSRDQMIGKTDAELFDPDVSSRLEAADREAGQHPLPAELEQSMTGPDGLIHTYWVIRFHLRDQRGVPYAVCTIATDITERKRVEDERAKLERQLSHSQRLESLGQLAGGVAHDFNNLLGAILNYAQFAREAVAERFEPSLPVEATELLEDLDQITKAGQRGASLTRQLLTFGRRDVTHPRVLNLNTVVRDVESMLRRTLGEHIQMGTSLAPDLSSVEADPAQLEQILINLAINARDAMPTGGRLLVETSNVLVDDEIARMRPRLRPGPYARISVSDTGTGMPPEVRDRAFEPFFTTKEQGKGTGLGLATAYGVISQANGDIEIYSEPSHGTRIRILLPITHKSTTASEVAAPAPPTSGWETVLVAEDEAAVREIARRLLTRDGYHVLTASNGAEALTVASQHAGPIHLLLTDVVMPQISGKQLAGEIRRTRPDIRVLYMSGYSEAILGNTQDASNSNILEKPFSGQLLAQRVRTALDAPPSESL